MHNAVEIKDLLKTEGGHAELLAMAFEAMDKGQTAFNQFLDVAIAALRDLSENTIDWILYLSEAIALEGRSVEFVANWLSFSTVKEADFTQVPVTEHLITYADHKISPVFEKLSIIAESIADTLMEKTSDAKMLLTSLAFTAQVIVHDLQEAYRILTQFMPADMDEALEWLAHIPNVVKNVPGVKDMLSMMFPPAFSFSHN